MIYAFNLADGCGLLLVEADDAVIAAETLRLNGYVVHPWFEAMGTLLVVRAIGLSDVYVSETR